MHGLRIEEVDNSLLHKKYQDPGLIHVLVLTRGKLHLWLKGLSIK